MRGMEFPPPYDKTFRGILSFARLQDAESCLRQLSGLRLGFLAAGDRSGLEYCREIARRGRKRAELISRNKRVAAPIRRQKEEIAFWFRTWLEHPDMFEDWLAMRKRAPSFREILQSESECFEENSADAGKP